MTTPAQWPDEYGKSFRIPGNALAVRLAILAVVSIGRFFGHQAKGENRRFSRMCSFCRLARHRLWLRCFARWARTTEV